MLTFKSISSIQEVKQIFQNAQIQKDEILYTQYQHNLKAYFDEIMGSQLTIRDASYRTNNHCLKC